MYKYKFKKFYINYYKISKYMILIDGKYELQYNSNIFHIF